MAPPFSRRRLVDSTPSERLFSRDATGWYRVRGPWNALLTNFASSDMSLPPIPLLLSLALPLLFVLPPESWTREEAMSSADMCCFSAAGVPGCLAAVSVTCRVLSNLLAEEEVSIRKPLEDSLAYRSRDASPNALPAPLRTPRTPAPVVISGAFINFLLHNRSVIYKIIIFFFRRSKRQRNFSLFYFASQES